MGSEILRIPIPYIERANTFFQSYELERVIACPDFKNYSLKAKPYRICRFCGNTGLQTSFKKDAHIFPEFLGNRYLISDFECDKCNELISKYENDLANFIGPLRFLQGISGKQSSSRFTSPDKNTRIQKTTFLGLNDVVRVSREDYLDNTFDVDHASGRTTMRFIKHTYTPLKVYKAFLKMALCCIEEADTPNYKFAIQSLMTVSEDRHLKQFANILAYYRPITISYPRPIGVVYKKKNTQKEILSHVFVLHFLNLTYQMVLPFNINDFNLFDGRDISLIYPPPIYAETVATEDMHTSDVPLHLASDLPVKGEIDTYTFEMDKESLDKAVIYDPSTGKTSTDISNFCETTNIILDRSGRSFKLNNGQ